MTTRVAINGFGRIGRMFLRSVLQAPGDLEVVAINDLADKENLAYLLAYDSSQGALGTDVSVNDAGFEIAGKQIRVLAERDPAALPWQDMNVDIAIEATGFFTQRVGAAKHLQAGAKKAIVSAPSKDADLTLVMGVNDGDYDPERHDIISNASCTTNCLAPVAKVILDTFGIETGFLTTTHAFTATQGLIDRPDKKDFRRGRAASLSIVPSSTGAATAVAKVIPELQGKLDGMALRVPTPTGSVVDFVVRTEKPVTVASLNAAFRSAAEGSMAGILGIAHPHAVSTDMIGNPLSSIVDLNSTMVLGEYTAKILSWYDNEVGYASRVKDLAQKIGAKLPVLVA
ncbi:type I glyceraldehyde-3-phosphate dehydrogenase [Synechococcus sp. PCC 7336]|uniref:type I glyceraldehyde-3-phosphate dehydrogenase n=1 Tax=Synechococcus sp. PCC 7336 TaxID=195250 RepID=UPI0003724FFD|nr:type I glyceraldehyde-3-phosphate dehydrogenase [Synechococcus sp. PCC 7336]